MTTKISAIATAASALSGSERLEIVQGGATKYVLPSQFASYVGASGLLVQTVLSKSADYIVTASDSFSIIRVTAADKVMTLPSTAAGLMYTFVLTSAGLSVGTGLQISPAAADKIMGNGFTSADNKDAILAGATDREGDSITIVGDGVDGWLITSVIGTWAREA